MADFCRECSCRSGRTPCGGDWLRRENCDPFCAIALARLGAVEPVCCDHTSTSTSAPWTRTAYRANGRVGRGPSASAGLDVVDGHAICASSASMRGGGWYPPALVIRSPTACPSSGHQDSAVVQLALDAPDDALRSATVRVQSSRRLSLTIRMMWCQRSSVMRRASLCPSFCHWTLDPNAVRSPTSWLPQPRSRDRGHGPAERVAFR